MGKLIPAKERVWVSAKSKSKYEALAGKGKDKKKSKKIFKSQASLFDLCAAIGLRNDERLEVENRVELVQSYSIDKNDALAIVAISKEPNLESEAILRRLEEYAEYGINKLHSWITKIGARSIGDLNLVTWLKLEGELESQEIVSKSSVTLS
jgi:hypothetical protein